MYRYKLDVFIADEWDDSDEEIAVSFLLSDYSVVATSHDPEQPRTWDETLDDMLAFMPGAELAWLALALQIGRETNSSRVLIDGKEQSAEQVEQLTNSTKLHFWRRWTQETVEPPPFFFFR